jgi:hypothetical protein
MNLTTILNLMRGFTQGANTPQEAAVQQAFQSLKVRQEKSRVVITGDLSRSVLTAATGAK